jgi:hypothetical protein
MAETGPQAIATTAPDLPRAVAGLSMTSGILSFSADSRLKEAA